MERRQMTRLAHVYLKLDGNHQHFELPSGYDDFRAWVATFRPKAKNPAEFDTHFDIVRWYLSHMSYANLRGLHQRIVWADDTESPVTVEHHPHAT